MTGMRKVVTLFLALGCVGVLAGCSRQQPELVGSQSDGIPKDTVLITHMSFIPHVITVTAGTTVTWQWDDGPTPHNVTFSSNGLNFASPNQAVGTYSHTFDTPGTYPYRCTLHTLPGMSGVVIVKPSA